MSSVCSVLSYIVVFGLGLFLGWLLFDPERPEDPH